METSPVKVAPASKAKFAGFPGVYPSALVIVADVTGSPAGNVKFSRYEGVEPVTVTTGVDPGTPEATEPTARLKLAADAAAEDAEDDAALALLEAAMA